MADLRASGKAREWGVKPSKMSLRWKGLSFPATYNKMEKKDKYKEILKELKKWLDNKIIIAMSWMDTNEHANEMKMVKYWEGKGFAFRESLDKIEELEKKHGN